MKSLFSIGDVLVLLAAALFLVWDCQSHVGAPSEADLRCQRTVSNVGRKGWESARCQLKFHQQLGGGKLGYVRSTIEKIHALTKLVMIPGETVDMSWDKQVWVRFACRRVVGKC